MFAPFHSFSRLLNGIFCCFFSSLFLFFLISKCVMCSAVFSSVFRFIRYSAKKEQKKRKKRNSSNKSSRLFHFRPFHLLHFFTFIGANESHLTSSTEKSKTQPKYIQQTNGKYFFFLVLLLLLKFRPNNFRYTSRHRYNSLGVARENA